MPDEDRVTIRLSPALYIQREARGSHYPPGARRLPDAAASPPNKCRRGRNDVGSHGSQHRGTPRADAGDAGTAGYVGSRPTASGSQNTTASGSRPRRRCGRRLRPHAGPPAPGAVSGADRCPADGGRPAHPARQTLAQIYRGVCPEDPRPMKAMMRDGLLRRVEREQSVVIAPSRSA